MNTQVTRKKSNRQQKVELVEHVRLCCERKLPIKEYSLSKTFKVGNAVHLLVDNKAIEPVGSPSEDLYKWITTCTPEEVVDLIWKVHGTVDTRIQNQTKIPNSTLDKLVPLLDKPLLLPKEMPQNSLPTFVQRCLEEVIEYGITDVAKQAKYLVDRLQAKYNIVKYNI